MEMHRAGIDELENFFGGRRDFIGDAERARDLTLPMLRKVRVASSFDAVEQARCCR